MNLGAWFMALFRLNEIELPGDVWTNPSDQPESYGPCGQNIGNIKKRCYQHSCPHSLAFRPPHPQAQQ